MLDRRLQSKRRECNRIYEGDFHENKPLCQAENGAAKRIEYPKEQDRRRLLEEHRDQLAGKDDSAEDHAKGDDLRSLEVIYRNVGVGGEFPPELELAGIDKSQRGARTNETLEVLRRLWSEEQVTFEGRFNRFHDVRSQVQDQLLLSQEYQNAQPKVVGGK